MDITFLLELETFSAKFDLRKISLLGPAKPIVWCRCYFVSYMNYDKQHECIYKQMTAWLSYIMLLDLLHYEQFIHKIEQGD